MLKNVDSFQKAELSSHPFQSFYEAQKGRVCKETRIYRLVCAYAPAAKNMESREFVIAAKYCHTERQASGAKNARSSIFGRKFSGLEPGARSHSLSAWCGYSEYEFTIEKSKFRASRLALSIWTPLNDYGLRMAIESVASWEKLPNAIKLLPFRRRNTAMAGRAGGTLSITIVTTDAQKVSFSGPMPSMVTPNSRSIHSTPQWPCFLLLTDR
ncbi:hypothetical protein U1Q18_044844 [Sarracenia purpurea var. burkii]